ncbi:AMP-binding protein [Ferriphaselus sp. R-1]|uniref:AMP-binding protein n=1 Tax=Ferriphaselus sp. R-1 TaxID=1485544 RepID=UPI00054F5AE9|nr:AMP-binding protein [Ferriphaselus sp. R-1]
MTKIPLVSHASPASVFAYRGGECISVARFLQDVAALAQALPDRRYILNLCTDRYHFAVGFAAALLRGQISLLPPNYTPSLVERLRLCYPGMYCLAEGAVDFQGVEVIPFPLVLEPQAIGGDIGSVPQEQCAALVFTSGSTGDPVAHPKSWGGLCMGALAEAESLGLRPDSGVALVGTVPAQHMYGLESCMLLAMQNGLAMVAERPFYPADIRERLEQLPVPRCLVTTPIHLRTLLAEPGILPELEFVLCATAPLALELAEIAEARFAAPLYEIYGCTEAGMVASRRTTAGAEWQLMSGLEMAQVGETCQVWGGHVGLAATLSDVIQQSDARTFSLHGRTADLVNIAGKRTSLASLNHQLNQIPGVLDGVFFVHDDRGDGAMARPQAFVVAPGLASEDILGALRKTIDAVFLPRPLHFVEALPRNSTGKLTRDSLLQLVQRYAKHE